MRISDWSSDVCSSDLGAGLRGGELLDLDRGRQPGELGARQRADRKDAGVRAGRLGRQRTAADERLERGGEGLDTAEQRGGIRNLRRERVASHRELVTLDGILRRHQRQSNDRRLRKEWGSTGRI